MLAANPIDFEDLYGSFHSPITSIDCGEKCAPYNLDRVPFCCDTRHAVPTAYLSEWEYLNSAGDQWHPWSLADSKEAQRIRMETPAEQVLIECRGYLECQRSYRAITCRAFPFFPYFDRLGNFLGLSYYWGYEDRCWVISHIDRVSKQYRAEFIAAYEKIFIAFPQEKDNFRYHSTLMRRVFGRKHRAIPLLHRNEYAYKITPATGRLRRIPETEFPRFGPYRISAELMFRDEEKGI